MSHTGAHMQVVNLPVLIIEDEPSVVSFISAALERGGYRSVAAASAAEGLELLRSGDYLGVISDMRTPGGVNGEDVHDWIAAHRPELMPRLLFITGDTANEETATILKETGAPYIEKPFRVQDLMALVQRVIGAPSKHD